MSDTKEVSGFVDINLTVAPTTRAESLQEQLYQLHRNHMHYLKTQVQKQYSLLPTEKKQALDQEFKAWLKAQPFDYVLLGLGPIQRFIFFQNILLSAEQRDFITWALTQGYTVEKEHKEYKIVRFDANSTSATV